MAHSKTRTNDGKITYPPGVKEISDKISKEEMVRRLKVCEQCVARQPGSGGLSKGIVMQGHVTCFARVKKIKGSKWQRVSL